MGSPQRARYNQPAAGKAAIGTQREIGPSAGGLPEGDIIIDLNAGFGPMPDEFKKARTLLTRALTNEFGSRLAIAPLAREMWPVTFK